jgi:hypothetical protein
MLTYMENLISEYLLYEGSFGSDLDQDIDDDLIAIVPSKLCLVN